MPRRLLLAFSLLCASCPAARCKTDDPDPASDSAAPVLSVLNGSYFVAARKAAGRPGHPSRQSAGLFSAIAAINGSAWLHTPQAHVHDTKRTWNQTLLDVGPFSVMNKSITPASGDKHDFICISAYYWPCNARCGVDAPEPKGATCATFCKPPARPGPDGSCLYQPNPPAAPGKTHASCPGSWCNNGSNIVSRNGEPTTGDCSCVACNQSSGLPWATHNGFDWPGAEVDRGAIDGVWENVIPLVLGWWYTAPPTDSGIPGVPAGAISTAYFARAAHILRVWFLDEGTKMKPNLDFADTYPGTGVGVGGTVNAARVHIALDMILLMESGDVEQQIWTAQDRAGMRDWVRKFLVWWRTSPPGKGAHGILQNIGTSWSLNAIAMALYIGDSTQATEIAVEDLRWRVSLAVNAKGEVWRELDHNAGSYSYVIGHLKELLDIATLGDRTGFGVDLWNYRANSTVGSIRLALEWMAPYCSHNCTGMSIPQKVNCSGWPRFSIDDLPMNECKMIYRIAGQHYRNVSWARIAEEQSDDRPYVWWVAGMGRTPGIPMSDLMTLTYPALAL
eukprot:SAG22_NODE_44_length_24912_cov_33.648894_1_plen_561_part_00